MVEKDVAAQLRRNSRRAFPDDETVTARAEDIVDALLTTPGVMVADADTLTKALAGVASSETVVPTPRCPECRHAVKRHDHGSMGGLGECLERTPTGLCWCKHYMRKV